MQVGEYTNIKLTTPEDMPMASSILYGPRPPPPTTVSREASRPLESLSGALAESGPLRAVHLSRHKWSELTNPPGHLVRPSPAPHTILSFLLDYSRASHFSDPIVYGPAPASLHDYLKLTSPHPCRSLWQPNVVGGAGGVVFEIRWFPSSAGRVQEVQSVLLLLLLYSRYRS